MIRSLISGLSGIRTHQTALDIIGNNIANINTPAYKAGRASFSDALSLTLKGGTPPTDTRGGLNPFQIGRGSNIDSIDTIFTQGSLETTGNPTDLTIAGEGFFVLRHSQEYLYTRDGSFAVDATGRLVDPNTGYAVQGRMADESGNILSSTPITDIILPIESLFPARATSNASLTGNLDADAEIGNIPYASDNANAAFSGNLDAVAASGTAYQKSIIVYDYAGNSHTVNITFTKTGDDAWTWTSDTGTGTGDLTFNVDGSFASSSSNTLTLPGWGTGGTTDLTVNIDFSDMTQVKGAFTPVLSYPVKDETYQTSLLVYDSLGATHNITINFERVSANSWRWTAGVSGGDILYISQGGATVLSGTLTFNTDGSVNTGGAATLIIEGSTGVADGVTTLDNLENGSAPITISLDLSDLVQFSGSFTPVPSYRDGHASGTLDNITFDDTGTLIGTFTNGASQKLAQLVLADFHNPAGLVKVGGNMYSVSMNSGAAVVGTAGAGIRASIVSNALEGSNVDLANEFTRMIIAQRGFEANSRVVTTSDAILGELINLKR